MDEFLLYVEEHLPTIINYVLTVLGYTLYFIVQAKVRKSRNSLTTLFKETNDSIRKDNATELEKAQKAYADAVSRIEELENKIDRNERMLRYMLRAEVKDDVSADRTTDKKD